MLIRPLDAQDDAEFARFHAIYNSALEFERPWATVQSLRDHRIEILDDDPGERSEAFVAVSSGGEVSGAGIAYLPVSDNRHIAWLEVMVEPRLRRRGIGSALLEHLVELARADGRTDVILETAYPFERRDDHPYRRFCERHGFALANTEVRRLLDLPLDEQFLDRLIGEAAGHHEGYRIETFDGPIPDDLLPSLCDTRNLLGVDAPTGALSFEEERVTPELWRHREDTMRAQGRTLLSTLALAPTGEVVAYNDLVILEPPTPNVSQWGTLVRREHRGHRLGMAVKARGLKELQARTGPHIRRVSTCNAEQNAHMIGINEALGFRAVEVTPSFLLTLPGPEAPALAGSALPVPATT